MKKNRIVNCLSVSLFLCLILGACNDNIPPLNIEGIGVDSIAIKETFLNSSVFRNDTLLLEEDSECSIARQVDVFPKNATDRAESYSVLDETIAEVTELGVLTALKGGNTTVCITVGGHEVSFPLTVLEKIIIPIDEISFTKDKLNMMVDVPYDLNAELVIKPATANEDIIYASSDETVVVIDKDGIARGLKVGTATITAKTKKGDKVATASVEVNKFSGNYDRKTWTMLFSQPIENWSTSDEGNGPLAAIDDNFSTSLCLVKPEWSQAGITVGKDPVWFVFDMKKAQVVNYFIIHHRENDMLGLRWRGFEKIEGSNTNNGTDWEVIIDDYEKPGSKLRIPDWDVAEQYESDTIKFVNDRAYRFIRFYTSPSRADIDYVPRRSVNDRGSLQFAELYLGILPEE